MMETNNGYFGATYLRALRGKVSVAFDPTWQVLFSNLRLIVSIISKKLSDFYLDFRIFWYY